MVWQVNHLREFSRRFEFPTPAAVGPRVWTRPLYARSGQYDIIPASHLAAIAEEIGSGLSPKRLGLVIAFGVTAKRVR